MIDKICNQKLLGGQDAGKQFQKTLHAYRNIGKREGVKNVKPISGKKLAVIRQGNPMTKNDLINPGFRGNIHAELLFTIQKEKAACIEGIYLFVKKQFSASFFCL